jgi:transglutaminase-like putative cysteine protease
MSGAITATIHTLVDGQDVLFGPPSPIGASLPVNADATVIGGDAKGNSQQVVISLLRSRTAVKRDSTYTVVSAVSLAPPAALRSDNTNYPGWIKQRYLQVPSEMPRRVIRLAQRLTGQFENPYDKASAVEAYLRQFPYNTQIDPPPPGEDGVDYFLFNVKQGYCDYYASAMVIMLRSVGVPARFVAGYAPGDYDPSTNLYTVREDSAHAWVEVFFPTYGWVQFEPTASQPTVARATQAPAPAPAQTGGQMGNPDQDIRDMLEQRMNHPGTVSSAAAQAAANTNPLKGHELTLAAGAIGLAAIGGLGVFAWRRNRRMFLLDSGLLMRLFGLLNRWAERLHVPWPASQTPLEHAHAFAQVLPEASAPIGRLTDMLVAQQYGRQEFQEESLQSAAGDWRLLRPMLWRRWLRQYVRMPQWLRRFSRTR